MTDLTVRLVLTADGRPLRTEIVGASRQVEQFTRTLEQGGVRVERSSVQAEAGMRRIGAAAATAGTQVSTAITGRALPALAQFEGRLLTASRAAATVLSTVSTGSGQFATLANTASTAAGALAGGIAGIAVQLAVFGAQMLFASRATEDAERVSRGYGEAQTALQRALTGVSEALETAEQRTRRLTIEQRQNAIAQIENARMAIQGTRSVILTEVAAVEAEIARAQLRAGRAAPEQIETFVGLQRQNLSELQQQLGVVEQQLESLSAAERRLFNAPLPSGAAGRPGATRPSGAARPRDDFDPFKRLREAGRALEQELRTPLERYNDEVQRLNSLLAGGFITQDTWYRGLARAREELDKAQGSARGATSEIGGLEAAFDRLIESSQGFGREAAKAASDALLGIRALDGGVGGLVQRLASGVIEKLIYEQITGPLTQAAAVLLRSGFNALFAPTPIPTGTPAQTNLGLRVVGGVHSGGIAGREATFHRAVPESLFDGAPRLHSGGYIGPGEVPAILKRGEGVFTPEQMAALGPGTTVQIIDQRGAGAPAMEVNEGRGPDGRRIIRAIVRAEMQAAIADGAIDREMSMAYGARRAGMR